MDYSKKDHDDQWLNSNRQSELMQDWYDKDLKEEYGLDKDDSDTKQWNSKGPKLDLYTGEVKALLMEDKQAKTLEPGNRVKNGDWSTNVQNIKNFSK